jgi:hypothetical protein
MAGRAQWAVRQTIIFAVHSSGFIPAMALVNSSLTIVFASSARRIKRDELNLLTTVPALADRALVTRTGP